MGSMIDTPPGRGMHYWTALPVLVESVYELWPGPVKPNFSDGFIFEIGSGTYSTPLLASVGCEFVSLEHETFWAKLVNDVLIDLAVSGRVIVEEDPLREASWLKRADLVYVDGRAKDRVLWINAAAKEGVRIIVYHDAEEAAYGYDGIVAPGYEHTIHDMLGKKTGKLRKKE